MPYLKRHTSGTQNTADVNRQRYATSPVRQFEASRVWTARSAKIRRDNPICQRLVDGAQCTKPAVLVHHIIPPEEAWHLRLDPRNLVALCDDCHPRARGGDTNRYTPTRVNVCGTTADYGHSIPRQEQQPQTLGPPTPKPIQAGSVSDAQLDGALADVADLLAGL